MRKAFDLVPTSRRLQSHLRNFAAAAEEQKLSDVAVAAGVPSPSPSRKVVIFSPARTASQQGIANTAEGGGPAWKIAFQNQGKWINPLMGWTSTADPLENVHRAMYFTSKEAAIEFVERNGWNYEVEELAERDKSRPKRYTGYGDNFSVRRKGIPMGGLRSEAQPAPSKRKK